MESKALQSVTVCALALLALFCAGCASTPTGVRIVASSATATNIGDVNWDEYKIPVLSIYTGPKTTIWINRDYLALKRIEAGGCVTNETSALGVYSTRERKRTRVALDFAARPYPSASTAGAAAAYISSAAASQE